jgi:hypothetical protein
MTKPIRTVNSCVFLFLSFIDDHTVNVRICISIRKGRLPHRKYFSPSYEVVNLMGKSGNLWFLLPMRVVTSQL